MRIVIISGSGHVGTYLVPRLVDAGHEVIVVSRNQSAPYQPRTAWAAVKRVTIDRAEAEAAGDFGPCIAALAGDTPLPLECLHCRDLLPPVSISQRCIHVGTHVSCVVGGCKRPKGLVTYLHSDRATG